MSLTSSNTTFLENPPLPRSPYAALLLEGHAGVIPRSPTVDTPRNLADAEERVTTLEAEIAVDGYDSDEVLRELSVIWPTLKGRRDTSARCLRDRFLRLTHTLYMECEFSLETLHQHCGLSPAYLSRSFKRLELKARHCSEKTPAAGEPYRAYSVAPDALSNTGDPNVAYVLGFLWADGHILVRKDGVPEGLRVVLNPRDEAHLDAIRRTLGSDAPIRSVTSQLSNGRSYPGACLTVYSHRLASQLVKLGFTKRKKGNGNVPPPAVPTAVEHHFWRGVCDGDGHIRRDKRYKFPLSGWELGICGPDAVVQAFQDFVKRKLRMRASAVRNGRSEVNYRGYVTGVRALILAETLYPKGCLALHRKYSVARRLSMARHAALELGMREAYQGSRLVYTNTSAAEPTVRKILS